MSATATPKRGRGKAAKTIALVEAAYEILEEIEPASVRAVCYQLFTRGLIADMSRKSTNAVGRVLVQAREEGSIRWSSIVDETREMECTPTWRDPSEIMRQAARQYRKSLWDTQPCRVEVWAEKGTVRGTLREVLDEYATPFRVAHGYMSATAIHDACEDSTSSAKALFVLYLGDWDPSGRHMDLVDLPERIHRYDGAIALRRIALREDDLHALPSFDAATKKEDKRFAWWHRNDFGAQCWELDAMPPPELRERVRQEIDALIDEEAWAHGKMIERAEIDSMDEVLKTVNSIFVPASKYSDEGGRDG